MNSWRGYLLAIVGAVSLGGCGASRSNGGPPQTAATTQTTTQTSTQTTTQTTTQTSPAPPLPPPPSRKGVILPSDTGIGVEEPSGISTTTGTNGKAVGPTLGNPGQTN